MMQRHFYPEVFFNVGFHLVCHVDRPVPAACTSIRNHQMVEAPHQVVANGTPNQRLCPGGEF